MKEDKDYSFVAETLKMHLKSEENVRKIRLKIRQGRLACKLRAVYTAQDILYKTEAMLAETEKLSNQVSRRLKRFTNHQRQILDQIMNNL